MYFVNSAYKKLVMRKKELTISEQLVLKHLNEKIEKYYKALNALTDLQEERDEVESVRPMINYFREKVSSIQREIEKIENV